MSHYMHHVPGRLRVRNRSFRCRPAQLQALAESLMKMPGVESVNIKYKAGSITVHYDPDQLDQTELFNEFAASGCVALGAQGRGERPAVGDIAQRALFGTLVHMTVERSVRSLVGALL